MTNELSKHEAPSAMIADDEMERLLADAYDAPPLPRSLLKRIDRAVESEWGQSPVLVANRAAVWKAGFSRTARWVGSVPVAAALVVIVVTAVLLNSGSRAYAWATMMQAVERQGVVQMGEDDSTRWLSLAEGVVSERTDGSLRLLDVRRKVLLERAAGGEQVVRRPVRIADSAGHRDQLMLGFLLGDSLSAEHSPLGPVARVIREDWESRTVAGAERIVLNVEFETNASSRFELFITLDPDSQLPLACSVLNDHVETELPALSYPAVTAAVFRERDFPSRLAVVDVGAGGTSPSEVAANISASAEPAANMDVATNISAVTRPEPNPDVAVPDIVRPPLFGAPSQWQPVARGNLSANETVRRVDELLTALWEENGVVPTEPADDEELLRRVYLDLVGRTPSVHEVRSYLDDPAEDRYEALVDRLLRSADHASHMATVWRTFLIPEGVDLDAFGGVEDFDRWLAERFAADAGYDELVRSLLLAEGRLSQSGPLLFYSAVKLDPDQLASRTARVFLGMRLECAQCHDHPFEPWSQKDFWSFAAFFAQISRPRGELENVSTLMRVRDIDRGEVMLPDTETVVPPRFLDGADFAEDLQTSARREQLAHWLTGPRNPYFARATANRVWGQLFGRGLVDPIDDFGSRHAPKSPELLDLLAGHFINHDFRLRELFRTVALSQAYRLSSGSETVDERRIEWFAQMNIKTLTAEQVYDCISVATMIGSSPAPGGSFNVLRVGNFERDLFLQQFRTPAGNMTDYQGGIPQALTLMNGRLIDGATGLSSSGLLKSLEAPFFTNDQRIEVLYLATLSRRPRPAERELLRTYIDDQTRGDELQEGLADILWALLNSAEFTLNH